MAASPATDDAATRRRRLLPALLLLGLVALAYWPALDCGFIWDDDDYVVQNPVLRPFAGIFRIWFEPTSLPQYYPLVHTTFWLEYRLYGIHPLGYHLVNIALHFGSSLLLLRLLRDLAVPGALLAAALFAVHPVQVESVAWVTERKNVLSLFCMLLAARQWLRWRDAGPRRSWWLATAWFAAALLSKTVTATLPAALLVVQWWRHGRIGRREVTSLLPWFGLGLGFGLFTAWLEATHVHGGEAPWQLAGAERLLVAGRAPWFYLGQLVWPLGFCFNYPRWQIDSGSFAQWLPVLATLVAPLLLFAWRGRIGRGPAASLLLFGGMLFPALGFFDVYPFRYSFVADHFQYHASTAMLAGLAAGVTLLLRRRLASPIAPGLAAVALLLLTVSSHLLTRNYRDLETLWQSTLATNPSSMLALINLGGLWMERGDDARAEPLLNECLRLYPDNYETLGNLGGIAQRRNDLATARRLYEAALAIREDYVAVLSNFASLEAQEGNGQVALALARRTIALEPDFYDGHCTLARVSYQLGNWQECLDQADWVLARTPELVDLRLLRARSLLQLGRHEPAMQHAGQLLAAIPSLASAERVLCQAMAGLFRTLPTATIAARLRTFCHDQGLDRSRLLPLVEAELRSLGDPERAAALRR
ncbi:MAG: tetratricopeptide repeat protein [Planctomycetes bacterium]|nr:tetratricopeptide repeat protein [Planctomycetota bacterium]